MMDDGALTLVRDRQAFRVGLFGGDVVRAVEGNPAAEQEARSFKVRMTSGVTTYLGGLGLGVLGIGLWQSGERNENIGRAHAGEALMLSGIAALFTGLGLMLSAQPHLWDAINLYNNGIDARLNYFPAPLPPYGAAPYSGVQAPAQPTAPTPVNPDRPESYGAMPNGAPLPSTSRAPAPEQTVPPAKPAE